MISKEQLPSPADVVSTIGLGMSLYGASEIGTTRGVLLFGGGRVLDLVDGALARRTYSSNYGPKVDAVFDKLAVAYGLYEAYEQNAVPELALAYIAVTNVVNAASNVYLDRTGHEARTSKSGKLGMFSQMLVFGGFALANSMDNGALEATSWTLTAASSPLAIKASYEYSKQAVEARASNKKATNAVSAKRQQPHNR